MRELDDARWRHVCRAGVLGPGLCHKVLATSGISVIQWAHSTTMTAGDMEVFPYACVDVSTVVLCIGYDHVDAARLGTRMKWSIAKDLICCGVGEHT